MAKITVQIPQPSADYDASNQQQIGESINTLKNQLNTSYQNDLRQNQETFNWFMA
jgi:hypothetical protein